ncbi:MAG: molybdopterin-dependent oxidoreductase [Immundisolibacter sp.]|uniref:molybdopterin-dependent oxidoreductase n=1 Tax=Immundisolibacter sp. TaxID=1934948 RepID=UPI003EE29904
MGKPETAAITNPARRRFLQASGGTAVALSLTQLSGVLSGSYVKSVMAAGKSVQYGGTEDLYRQIWNWDKVSWGSHTNACLPGCCSFHVYVKDGMVWREEQAARNPASNENYPDYNPLGCQKGCSFHANLYGDHRIKYPLRRVGERGSAKWERISWDDALTDIASAIVDGLEEMGSDGFLLDPPHEHAGTVSWAGAQRMNSVIGGVLPDLNVLIGDFYKGIFDTIGKMHTGYSADNLFDAELIFLTYSNWSYTMPAIYHFLTEARYNGTEIVSISPDYNPTSITADYHVPVNQGCDAAFWLGICQVIMADGLVDEAFVKEQTDLPLLVRADNGRYLRQTDVDGGGREDQLYLYDLKAGAIAKAPRATLLFDGEPALEGQFEVTLATGEKVAVTTVYALLKAQINANHTPEQVQQQSGAHPSLTRMLAKKVATKRTCSYIGFSSAKTYHGDLGERALMLAMALSGNWGKPGTGWNTWAMPADHIELMMVMEKTVAEGGLAAFAQMEQALATKLRAEDPEITEELIGVALAKEMTTAMGLVPPAMFLYNHCGYKEAYDNKAWQDPTLKKTFGEYLSEATEQGWWQPHHLRPAPGKHPRVMMITSSNPVRRNRSGAQLLPKHLFPKLKMMFAIEPRMSASALYCDIILPAAWYYEKMDMTVSITANPRFAFIEKAVNPPGECEPEWEIYAAILKRVGEIAAARGLESYGDHFGQRRVYGDLWSRYTMGGKVVTQEQALTEMLAVAEATSILPKGTTLESFRKAGMLQQVSFGTGFMKHLVANDYSPDKPFFSLAWHRDKKITYPTYSRRAQFFLDHPWYIEAGEALPVHKEPPKIGGDHPFVITGGHPRHSIHSLHLNVPELMRLHRAQPVMHVNDKTAARLGMKDGEQVRVYNDFSDFEIMLRTSPTVAPMQVVVYFWENPQFKEWKVYDRLLIGQPKPLHLAGGYEQLRYYLFNGSPGPSTDRGVRVAMEKLPV